jgi:hypothetical protein
MQGSERRRYPRTEVVATATVIAPGRYAGTYLVSNFSTGGALLLGDALLKVGDEVRILLELPSARLVRLSARVLRHEDQSDGHLFAVMFHDISPETEDLLQDLVVTALAKSRRKPGRLTVLVLTRDSAVRARLEADLRDLDLHASACTTPLSALVILNASRPAEIAIVDLGLEQAIGADFLAFLAEVYPRVRRVALMSGADSEQACVAAQAMLPRSWSESRLGEAIIPPR